jgi:uncharacterized protein
MRLAGTFALSAPPAEVFEAIRDPRVLMSVIPGCEAVEQVAPDEYTGRIALRLPGVVGSYRTWVRVVDAVAPERAGLDGRVEGSLGSIVGHADFTLTEEPAGTLLAYRGEGSIAGPLARLDARFTEHLAASLIAQGLRALDGRLARQPAGAATGDGPAPSTEVSE